MSTVLESRGVQYSAEAVGSVGVLRCHIIRRTLERADQTHFSIVVRNETVSEVDAFAFIPDALDLNRRTIVKTTIGRASDFSTSVILEVGQFGPAPELHIELTCGDIYFALIVPRLATERGPGEPPVDRGRGGSLAAVVTSSALRPIVPAQRGRAAGPATPVVTMLEQRPAMPRYTAAPLARTHKSPAATPMFLLFTALMATVAAIVFRPQIEAFVVPSGAVSETGIPIAYRATGLGALEYRVFGPDGAALAGGPLTIGSGSFTIVLPRAYVAQAYLVRLNVANVLGSAVAEDYIRVAGAPPAPTSAPARRPRRPAPPPEPPLIRSLALDRATLASGEPLNVYYDVSATSGTIALVDPAAQITFERSAIGASGQAAFRAPHVDTARVLSVVLSARRGTAQTQSRISVTVMPSAPQAAPPSPIDPAPATNATATSISAPLRVRGGQPITVDVHGAAADVLLVLLDATGTEVARRDVPSGQPGTNFSAPLVRAPTRFLFEATFPSGAGSETIVRAITVTP